MRTEMEIRRRLVYLMQQKGYLMQEIAGGKKYNIHKMRAMMEELENNTVETKVLKWILRMEDN